MPQYRHTKEPKSPGSQRRYKLQFYNRHVKSTKVVLTLWEKMIFPRAKKILLIKHVCRYDWIGFKVSRESLGVFDLIL